ncbi:MAG: M2 family metallopeptidase [Deltaproteobacteria bacterium]|nr:M2 family metallopeptidase [Deltaproteobacteria bacterium]
MLLLLATLAHADDGAQRFLDLYDSLLSRLYALDAEASWQAATDVSDLNQGRREAASQATAAFVGDPHIIERARQWRGREKEITPLQLRQLDAILYAAGEAPGDQTELVNRRIAAEARQGAAQDGFEYCMEARGADGKCAQALSANDIDGMLQAETDAAKRLKVWTTSKEIGVPLKAGLGELRELRNGVAKASGFSSYFGYQVSEYGMSADEMMALLDQLNKDMAPLYKELHTWAKRQLAKKYGQPVPEGDIPAHWLPNRWGQEWGGLVQSADLDPYFEDKSPEWIIESSEQFYVSMGFPELPKSFWEKSDLYPVPDGQSRHKNSHASAWHMDLKQDIRSLMSVEPDSQWFGTSHHELGHIYYYISYTRPEVPLTLRKGANRAFHEGIGELANVAAFQPSYLKQLGILPKKHKSDPTQVLLAEALEQTVAFVPFATGTMSRFEYELYEKNLPADQWQKRWWEIVSQYQGIAVPDKARLTDPALCDACTKTHINDDPAQYYDYALATVIKYQLHEHIAKKILKQDPHDCNYYGSKEAGAFIKGVLEKGATEDWREVLKDATGEELSTRAMVAYFEPLRKWLQKENRKR